MYKCSPSFTGNKVLVRCLRLLKPYTRKGVADDDDDEDEDEEDDTGARRRGLPSEGRIMENDVLSQAYHIGRFITFLIYETDFRDTVCQANDWIHLARLHVVVYE